MDSLNVTSEGKPVPDADLTVFVVDDAVLQLGDWQLPDLIGSFYYERAFGVKSYESLDSYQETSARQSLTHKGFIIGDGGEEKIGNVVNVRKEFQTLAFWAGALKTDHEGNASFEFTAPDNLTTYRLVALGATKESRFGGDAGTTLKIFKPVLVQAALPRFLRDGDEIELRAVVHQSFANSDELTRPLFDRRELHLVGCRGFDSDSHSRCPHGLSFQSQGYRSRTDPGQDPF